MGMRKLLLRSGFSIIILSLMLLFVGCDIVDEVGSYSSNGYIEQGNEYMDKGEVESAIAEYEKAVESGRELAVAYNNLSWAYNELGDPAKGLEYIVKAQKIEANDPIQLINYGNSLYGLYRYKEAIEKYNEAIDIDNREANAHYGKGLAYMGLGNYSKSEGAFKAYLKIVPDDFEAKLELTNCYLYDSDFLTAYSYIETVIEDHPTEFEGYDLKGYILEYLETEDRVEVYYEDLTELFPGEVEAWLNLGNYNYDIGYYLEAIDAYELALSKFPDDELVLAKLSSAYSLNGDIDKAFELAHKAIEVEPSTDNYNNLGNVLFDQTKYLEAITYYKKANEVSEYLDEAVCSNIAYAYLMANRYQKSIDFGLSVIDELSYSYDIPWLIALGYEQKNNYSEAIKYLEIALDNGADKYEIYYGLAENYYYLGEYEETQKYIDKLLENNLDDYDALYLQDYLELKESGSENLVRSIFDDYYLYGDINAASSVDLSEFKDLNYEETENLFYSLAEEDDPYTFYLYGEIYEYMIEEESSSIDFEVINDDTVLVNINFFNENTDHLFIEYIDGIENTEDKNLVINVMDNGGGVTDSAVNILDTLLPSLTICSLIDRTGYSYPYYSSESMTEFKDIYIFINENSASASELVTLGLNTYLDNVTVVGQQSHGKGVGQLYFEEPNKKTAYFVVNHYWNVRENNILGVGIEPEILVDEPSIENNFEAIGLK